MFNLGLRHSWIGPFRYKIADLSRDHGDPHYSGGRVDFCGTLMHRNEDLSNFKLSYTRLNALAAFAMFPDNVDISVADSFWNTSFVDDSSRLGDSVAGTWRILAMENSHPYRTFSRESQALRVLSGEYCRCGFDPIGDYNTAKIPIVRNVGVGMDVQTSVNGTGRTFALPSHIPVPIHGKRTRGNGIRPL